MQGRRMGGRGTCDEGVYVGEVCTWGRGSICTLEKFKNFLYFEISC